MQNIRVNRYEYPEMIGWQGWIEPDDLSWILFIDLKGRVHMYDERNSKTGAVL